uniref:Uncharacterized protein n=1 Tax=virus sp. ctrcb4 TaxID=2825824 RepID=A0A8S5RQA5_9VIRU|nr:MAG TPA: hypothetical protein [virus sp. ctrcb4]DAH01347.1 MAG TPA: hypothetical protein [Crassvirales sp.]DAR12699.1 MAG TPA: hypothetical protein [Crassvirales sp.]
MFYIHLDMKLNFLPQGPVIDWLNELLLFHTPHIYLYYILCYLNYCDYIHKHHN